MRRLTASERKRVNKFFWSHFSDMKGQKIGVCIKDKNANLAAAIKGQLAQGKTVVMKTPSQGSGHHP